jgi:hypothetical protein
VIVAVPAATAVTFPLASTATIPVLSDRQYTDLWVALAGTITAESGDIGNWKIQDGGLSYTREEGQEPSCYLGPIGKTFNDKGPYVFKAGDNFGVTPDGVVYATGADLKSATVSGIITAEEGGSIGGISINANGISSSEAPKVPYIGMV